MIMLGSAFGDFKQGWDTSQSTEDEAQARKERLQNLKLSNTALQQNMDFQAQQQPIQLQQMQTTLQQTQLQLKALQQAKNQQDLANVYGAYKKTGDVTQFNRYLQSNPEVAQMLGISSVAPWDPNNPELTALQQQSGGSTTPFYARDTTGKVIPLGPNQIESFAASSGAARTWEQQQLAVLGQQAEVAKTFGPNLSAVEAGKMEPGVAYEQQRKQLTAEDLKNYKKKTEIQVGAEVEGYKAKKKIDMDQLQQLNAVMNPEFKTSQGTLFLNANGKKSQSFLYVDKYFHFRDEYGRLSILNSSISRFIIL